MSLKITEDVQAALRDSPSITVNPSHGVIKTRREKVVSQDLVPLLKAQGVELDNDRLVVKSELEIEVVGEGPNAGEIKVPASVWSTVSAPLSPLQGTLQLSWVPQGEVSLLLATAIRPSKNGESTRRAAFLGAVKK